MFKHILVPIDGSALSLTAVKAACGLAGECGAQLTIYYARPGYLPPTISGEVMVADFSLDATWRSKLEQQAEAILAEASRVAAEAGVSWDAISSECDTPHVGIIATAEERGCDLIFMASHGRRGAIALLLGSETLKVITHSRIPVLVHR